VKEIVKYFRALANRNKELKGILMRQANTQSRTDWPVDYIEQAVFHSQQYRKYELKARKLESNGYAP